MRVAITGASGFVGAALVRRLLAEGHEVRCLVRRSVASLEGLDVERVQGDVLDPASLDALFRGAERSFHLAARISIDGDHGGAVTAINVDGARNAARAALRAGVRRHVHVSSVHSFDSRAAGTLDETAPRAGPTHPAYDRSKVAGEAAVRELLAEGLDAVIAYPGAVLGPGDHEPSRVGRALRGMATRRLPALLPGGFGWVDVRDVVDGLLGAAERGRRGEGYLLTGPWAPITEVAELVGAAAGRPPLRRVLPIWVARATAPAATAVARLLDIEPLYTREGLLALEARGRFDCAKASRELGFAPRPLRESIEDTVAYFRERGWLP